ncbi:MAG: leucine-rich repeat domain-containing protein, partial [Candidatus Hodarchaeota archaeon]
MLPLYVLNGVCFVCFCMIPFTSGWSIFVILGISFLAGFSFAVYYSYHYSKVIKSLRERLEIWVGLSWAYGALTFLLILGGYIAYFFTLYGFYLFVVLLIFFGIYEAFRSYSEYFDYQKLNKKEKKETNNKDLAEMTLMTSYALFLALNGTFIGLGIIIVLKSILGIVIHQSTTFVFNTTLIFLFLLLIFYPLFEFIYFTYPGQQTTEVYHKLLERLLEFIKKVGNKALKHKKPQLWTLGVYQVEVMTLISGILLYTLFFGFFFPILSQIILSFFSLQVDFLLSIIFSLLLYPAIILGYYASLGAYNSLSQLFYNHQYKNLECWFNLVALLLTSYAVINLVTGIPLGHFINLLLDEYFAIINFRFSEWSERFISLLPVFTALYLTVSGFYKDYWTIKPRLRIFDYIFSIYILSSIVVRVLLSVSTSLHETFQYSFLPVTNNVLFIWLSNSDGLFVLIFTLILIVASLKKYSTIHRSEKATLFWLELILGEPIPKLKTVDQNSFGYVFEEGHVTYLCLANKGIKTLPEDIEGLKQLKGLFLQNCRFFYLPEVICSLSSLQVLNVQNTGLNGLPQSIGNLSNLKALDVSHNSIFTIPPTIGQIQTLKWVDFSNNYTISDIPESFIQLTNLRSINLEGTEVQTLPFDFTQLNDLQYLNLWNSSVKTFPLTFKHLQHLKILCSQNIPADVRKLFSKTKCLYTPIEDLYSTTHLDIDLQNNSLIQIFYSLTAVEIAQFTEDQMTES